MNLNDQIIIAQRTAGENAVIENLKKIGILDDEYGIQKKSRIQIMGDCNSDNTLGSCWLLFRCINLKDKDKLDMSENYLKRSNESLGKMVRETAQRFHDERGFTSSMSITGSHLLVTSLIELNATDTTINLEGFTDQDGIKKGDWEIKIKKIKQ